MLTEDFNECVRFMNVRKYFSILFFLPFDYLKIGVFLCKKKETTQISTAKNFGRNSFATLSFLLTKVFLASNVGNDKR